MSNRILILEDELLVALDLEYLMEENVAGAKPILAGSVAQARQAVADGIDVAILDIDVLDGKSFPLAYELQRAEVPFVFVSAAFLSDIPGDLRGAPFLRKPVQVGQLVDFVHGALARRQAAGDVAVAPKAPSWTEAERLAALRSYDILDTEREGFFDELTEIAALICKAPIAVVNLVADTRQFFKAEIGLGVRETPVDISICAHAILQRGVFVVPDTTLDRRFASNPLVTGEPRLRFYAGALLETPEGIPIGTVCVLDHKSRPEGLTREQELTLQGLARAAMAKLEYRKIAASLRRREEELARLQEIAGIGGTEVDLRTGFTNDRSPQYLKIHGLPETARRESHENWVARLHPEDRERVETLFRDAVKSGASSYLAEYRIIRPSDGELRWISARAEIEHDPQGAPIRLVAAHQDITERKRAEEAIQESERRLRAVLDTMPQIVWTTRPDGHHDYFNKRWFEFTGRTSAQSEGAGWNPVLHPEDRQKALDAWSKALATGDPYEIEYRFRAADGAYRWFIGRAVALRDCNGQVERWFGTCTDVHELKLAQSRLNSNEERLRLALEAGKVGTWVWLLQDGVVHADEQTAAIYGIDPELAGNGAPFGLLLPAVHPEDRSRLQAMMTQAAGQGGEHEVEHRVTTADGGLRWIVSRGRCELDAQGRPYRFPGASVDITDLKRVEEARELISRELSHRIQNLFSLVNGLISLSARSRPEAADFATDLKLRLETLARANDYVRPQIQGAMQTQTLHGLIRLLLTPYANDGDSRLSLVGDDIAIGSGSATALALVLHEQATNAVKYGALSVEAGRLELATQIDGANLVLVWREREGPPVTAVPSRQGFGTVLAARSMAGQLGGAMTHDWRREGLLLTLRAPLERLRH
ncbi:MAG: PAS domain-containing protein [Bosea sp. (in: a-proteobacteria)]